MKTQLFLTLLQNLCSGLRLVHICNHGVHGFLFLHVLLKKHMKTQLILTILNLHLFSYLGFPKISKTLLSHVWGGNAARRLFCFTSAAVLIIFFQRLHFVTRLRRNVEAALFCLTSAAVLTFFFSPLRSRLFINREARALSIRRTHFSPLIKKVLVAPAPLTKLTKHIVRLRCRCSCKIYSTSAVPLLVISETSVFLS